MSASMKAPMVAATLASSARTASANSSACRAPLPKSSWNPLVRSATNRK